MLQPMTRACLWVCALACAGTAALLTGTLQGPDLPTLALLHGSWAGVAAVATRTPVRWLGAAFTLVLSGVMAAVGATAVVMGWGLAAPALPVAGLMVCVLCAANGWRAGTVLATVAVAVVLGVALTAPGRAGPALPSPWLQLGTHLMAIAAGLACGVFISQVMARAVAAAHDREERFRRLLAVAADGYWEIDPYQRIIAAAEQTGPMRPLQAGEGLGSTPWDLPALHCEPDTLDRLLADLESRVPFRDVPMHWLARPGAARAYLVSGEPRYDDLGVFLGFWGVARDMTAVQATRQALAATETRYHQLFSRIPTPLVLHRGGQPIDANPAALALFGHADLASMRGCDLLEAYESGDSRERARRCLEQLQQQPLGTATPAASYKLRVQGREVSVRCAGVSVEAAGGPAMLAMYIDDTERLAAEDAVRRSEAMLSHLVATSPDVITLTDLDSGRYAMVNRSFEQLSGWTAAEAVGRTSLELGVWADEHDRTAFVGLVRSQGTVADHPARFMSRAGKAIPMVISAARFMMDRREYLVINARDVSERDRQRLEREAILANASIGIAVTRGQRFVLANRHFEQLFGWASGELPGQPASVVWCSADDYAEIGRVAGPVLASGQPVELERPACRQDGSRFVARIRGRAIDPARPHDSGTMWIVEDVTERRQFEQALARARDDAEAANRAKSAFLANTSHELRTPLNGIIGLARLARDEATTEPRRRQYLDQIALSAQSLAGIISDILDLSKIEAGKLQLEATHFDLRAELETLHRTYAPMAAAQGLALLFDAAPGISGLALGDPLRLRQIVSNFITNAIKFTPAGWVVLHARRQGGGPADTVRVEVRDSGPGLEAETRARLFQPFTQADQSTTRRYGGTGLGLSICRELATLMGGRVGVESAVGHGSTFWAELPLPAIDSPASALPLRAPSAAPASTSAASLEVLRTDPAGLDDTALAGTRVLLAEDNAVNMMIASALLQKWGVAVVEAPDGRAAVSAVQQAQAAGQPLHAVLMDVQMPVMSGHEATRVLRAEGHTLPIIALTAAALVTEREAALQAGMDDFLTKPIDADKLRAALVYWCGARR